MLELLWILFFLSTDYIENWLFSREDIDKFNQIKKNSLQYSGLYFCTLWNITQARTLITWFIYIFAFIPVIIQWNIKVLLIWMSVVTNVFSSYRDNKNFFRKFASISKAKEDLRVYYMMAEDFNFLKYFF